MLGTHIPGGLLFDELNVWKFAIETFRLQSNKSSANNLFEKVKLIFKILKLSNREVQVQTVIDDDQKQKVQGSDRIFL